MRRTCLFFFSVALVYLSAKINSANCEKYYSTSHEHNKGPGAFQVSSSSSSEEKNNGDYDGSDASHFTTKRSARRTTPKPSSVPVSSLPPEEEATSSDTPAHTFEIADSNFMITFGFHLIAAAESYNTGNIVVSPYSVSMCLALIQQGAYGETQNQLTNSLDLGPDHTNDFYKSYNSYISRRKDKNELKIASNIFMDNEFDLNPAFKRTAMRSFNSDVTLLSFGRPESAVRKINKWVSTNTMNRIPQLVTSDSITEDTMMVLANTIYFKGLWETTFSPEMTSPGPFHLKDGKIKQVPFMRMKKMFQADYDESVRSHVINMPFENNAYSFMVILPAEGAHLDRVMMALTDAKLLSYHSLSKREVKLDIPKFTVKDDTDLIPVLKLLGITKVFSSSSELSGIGSARSISPRITSAVHSVVLSIDETGATAAAATAFGAVALSFDEAQLDININRPFLAIIWDIETECPIFMGKIEDPTI